MCALSEYTVPWEILNEYRLDPKVTELKKIAAVIAAEKHVSLEEVTAILTRHYGSVWKDSASS